MNPLHWSREHQVAGAVICVVGGIAGTLYAWFDSRFYLISKSNFAPVEWRGAWGAFFTG
jgi:hypothetical protein